MTDRIEALERLQRLRESGAITDAEFAREKEALMRAASVAPRAWAWIAAGVLALALIAAFVLLAWRRDDGRQGNSVATNVVQAPATAADDKEALAAAEPAIRTRPESEQLAAAFRAAFGSDRRATRTLDGAAITFTPGGLRWIGARAVLVSPGRNSQDCHACAGELSVHYLNAEADGFRVAGEWLTAIGGAGFGAPPEWRFSTELTDQPVLRVEGGGGNQGIFCSVFSFYALGSAGPAQIADIQTGYSNASGFGDDDGSEINGRIANVRKNISFEVAYTGTRSFVERWVWRGDRFVMAGGASRMPTC